MADNRPIGLFDSGIGGLTVLGGLLAKFPNETFIYLGDTARLPYGSKSPETIHRYLNQNIQALLKYDVKAIVVACNSASTICLKIFSETARPSEREAFPVPIYNVIEPGALTASQATVNKRIGVLGTQATIASNAYVKTLLKIDPNLTIFQQACPLLVPLVEEGWESDPLTNLVIYRYVQPIVTCGVDTIILGCTHYPALREGIARVAGHRIRLIDASQSLGDLISNDFASGKLVPSASASPFRLLATDASPGFLQIARRLIAPHEINSLESIDIGPSRE